MYLQKYSTDKQIKTLQAAEYANALLHKKNWRRWTGRNNMHVVKSFHNKYANVLNERFLRQTNSQIQVTC